MIRRPPTSTRTDTLFPYTTLFRSFAGCISNLEVEHVLWRHSVRCFGLQEHPQDPPFTVEVIGICAAESDRERSVNVANREAEGASLSPVDHDPQLRCIFLALRSNTAKDRALARGGKQLTARVAEGFSTVAAPLIGR